MDLRLAILNELPPGGWRYLCKETGVWIRGDCPANLYKNVRQHLTANQLPIPINLDAQIDNQMCGFIPPEWCTNTQRQVVQPSSLTLAGVLQGTKTIAHAFLSGRGLVEQAEAEERARVCVHCEYNQPIPTCAACALEPLRKLVGAIIGNRKTPYDAKLETCAVCECTNKAKVWFPKESILKYLSDDQKAKLPAHCWVTK